MRQKELSIFHLVKLILLLLFLAQNFTSVIDAKTPAKRDSVKVKTIYKYKKFEKFDFEELVIQGEIGSPGELSITPGYQRKFKNVLPYRKNFNAEIKKAVERIR